MKAVVTTGKKREIVIKDIPKPQARPGTLLLKTRYCSICGSDLEYLDGSFAYRGAAGELHAGGILGHEFCAEVVEVGEEVEGWSVGDRVAPGGMRRAPCGQCYFCRRGLYNLCWGKDLSPRARDYNENIPGGYGNKLGAMAEYFIRPSTRVQKVPDSVSDEEAAVVEPLAVGLATVTAANLKDNDPTVIIGAGKIGLGAMLCAKAAGVTPIIIIDLVKSRLDKALEMGADAVLNAREADVILEVVKLAEAGPDAVLICVRDGNVLNQAAEMVRRSGTIVLAGYVAPAEVNAAMWTRKFLKIIPMSMSGGGITAAMRLLAQRQVNVKPMISEIIPLEEAQRAFDSMYSGENIVSLLKP